MMGLVERTPEYGFFLNASKTKLFLKCEIVDILERVFSGSRITISTEGNKFLGCPIGSRKIIELKNVLKKSRMFSKSQMDV